MAASNSVVIETRNFARSSRRVRWRNRFAGFSSRSRTIKSIWLLRSAKGFRMSAVFPKDERWAGGANRGCQAS
jgi:hypothetical protein